MNKPFSKFSLFAIIFFRNFPVILPYFLDKLSSFFEDKSSTLLSELIYIILKILPSLQRTFQKKIRK